MSVQNGVCQSCEYLFPKSNESFEGRDGYAGLGQRALDNSASRLLHSLPLGFKSTYPCSYLRCQRWVEVMFSSLALCLSVSLFVCL